MKLPTHIVATGGVVINDNDEILLVKNPLKGWEFPGGIVEVGETVPEGLIREIQEESGVDVEIINIAGIYSNTKKKKGYNGVKEIPTIVTIDFICKYISGELFTSDENIDVKWVSKEEALKIIKSKQLLRLKKALNYQLFFPCIGYQVNSSDEIEVHEEYLFPR